MYNIARVGWIRHLGLKVHRTSLVYENVTYNVDVKLCQTIPPSALASFKSAIKIL